MITPPELGGGALLEFLADLQADLIGRIDRCPGHSDRRRRQVMVRMQRARLCLEGRMDGGLRIGELARRIHFSPWYFSKVFQALYDIGPLQFSVRMRLEHAHRLLATTCLPVTEVSAAVSFSPVALTVTVAVEVPPLLSVMVTVKVSVVTPTGSPLPAV